MSKPKGKSSKKLAVPESVLREQAQLKQLKSLDPTNLKQEIYSYKRQLNDLIAEVNTLNMEIAQNNEDYLLSTYDLQQRLKNQEETLTEVKHKHSQVGSECDSSMKDLRKQWDLEKSQIVSKKNKQYNDAKERLQDLTRKLQHIKMFKQKEHEYVQTIAELNMKIENLGDIHKEELNKIKQDHIKTRMQIQEQSRKNIEQIKELEHEHAQAKLGDREKHTKKENQILQNQIELYQEEEVALAQQAERLQGEIRQQQNLLQELSNLNPTRQNHERSLKIINLQEKINQLKTFMADELRRLEVELVSTTEYYEKQEKELEKEIKKVRDASRKRDKQTKDLKMYSQMVLDQRGSLEWYLLQVLSDHQNLGSDKLANLDLILRHLFTKINSGIQPSSWRKLPLPQPITNNASLQL